MAAPVLSEAQVALLVEELAQYTHDPYGFALWAFPWGEENSVLADIPGLSDWQVQILKDLGAGLITMQQAMLIAVAGGKGGGKSMLLSIIILWAFSTFPETRGRVTANTRTQLETVTWAEVNKWFNMFIARDLFEFSATSLHAIDKRYEKTWRIDAMPWSKENPDAFRGLHNYGKRIIIVTDEASGIDDVIWNALDGTLTDTNTEIIWVAASNPSRNYGRFRECFPGGKHNHSWKTYRVDTRTIPFTNKKQIADWAKAWGEDSDYFKVNVLGEFPSVSSLQLIPTDTILEAQSRTPSSQPYEPLIFALDVARFGDNKSVLARRRGNDMKTMPRISWRGLSVTDLAARCVALCAEHNPDAFFIDEGGIGGGVVDVVRSLGFACIGVNFGSKPSSRPDGSLVANKRAEMYVMLRNWLARSGAIEADEDVFDQLVALEFGFNQREEILLESKEEMRKRGVPSPDDADAYAMTFAYPVSKKLAWGGTSRECDMTFDPLNDNVGPQKLRFQSYNQMMGPQ